MRRVIILIFFALCSVGYPKVFSSVNTQEEKQEESEKQFTNLNAAERLAYMSSASNLPNAKGNVSYKQIGSNFGRSRYDNGIPLSQINRIEEWRKMKRKEELKKWLGIAGGIGLFALIILLLKPKGDGGIKFENQNKE